MRRTWQSCACIYTDRHACINEPLLHGVVHRLLVEDRKALACVVQSGCHGAQAVYLPITLLHDLAYLRAEVVWLF